MNKKLPGSRAQNYQVRETFELAYNRQIGKK